MKLNQCYYTNFYLLCVTCHFFRIRSDHNEDKSPEILHEWLTQWAGRYHGVDTVISPSPPYRLPDESGPAHWPLSRYSLIINLREKALNLAREMWADYIWVSE